MFSKPSIDSLSFDQEHFPKILLNYLISTFTEFNFLFHLKSWCLDSCEYPLHQIKKTI